MGALGRIGQVLNRTLQPFGLRVVRIAENQAKRGTDSNPLGSLVHCLVTDNMLVNHIRQRPKTATRKQAQDLEQFVFEREHYLSYCQSLEPFEAFLQRTTLPKNFSLLDIGCAVGQLVPFVQEIGSSGFYAGIDIAYELVASAQRRFHGTPGHYHFLEADASEMPFPNSCFDVVYSRSTLISTYDWKQSLREHLRVARRWVLFLQVPFHRGEMDTIFYLQHSKLHTSLLCGFTQEIFLEQLPKNAQVEIRNFGSGFEVINFGRVDWHDVFIELT